MAKKKSEGKISKLLLGVVVGGAVGSVLGVALSDKKNRKKISRTSQKVYNTGRKYFSDQVSKKKPMMKPKKKGFWHMLNYIFHGKKK